MTASDAQTAKRSAPSLTSRDERLVRDWKRGRRRNRIAAIGLPLAIAIGFVSYWQYATTHRSNASVLIPTFTDFVRATWKLLGLGDFWHAVWVSESALLTAFGMAVAIGIPFGIYVGRHRTLDGLTSGYLDIAVVTPTAVFMPLIIVFLGPTYWARVTVIFIFAFAYIVLPCRVASSTVSGDLVDMAHSYGAKKTAVWRDVIVPASVPGIFAGLRQGVAHAFTGMFLIELTFLAVGLGYLIVGYEEAFDPAYVFGVSLIIVVQAAVCMSVFQYVENRLSAQWRSAGRK
ncbi:MAG: NitT/TauT family transport system permease protein [Pseudonocardiales bacterium]|nr:NitT/TauT family transport system permease protein [Pseudonocardiales bacterium]